MERRSEVWRDIWQTKYSAGVSSESSDRRHMTDGFDSLSVGQWKKLVGFCMKKCAVTGSDDVLDIGCGSGAFLEQIPRFRSLSGVDYSSHAIRFVKRRLAGTFRVAEANVLPFRDESFDVTISWSVFFYFDSLRYAQAALDEMSRVTRPGGRIFVGDVNDLEKKELARKLREESRTARERQYTSVRTADQLFYPKDFFRSYADGRGMTVTFYDEDIEELVFYENSRYRYSLLIELA